LILSAGRCDSVQPEQPEPTPQQWGDQTTNRPAEYNTLDDKYARVIVDELMPALDKDYNISKDHAGSQQPDSYVDADF